MLQVAAFRGQLGGFPQFGPLHGRVWRHRARRNRTHVPCRLLVRCVSQFSDRARITLEHYKA